MKRWVKLFLQLRLEVTQDQNRRINISSQRKLIGLARLEKDDLSGKKYWVSWDGEGNSEVTFSGGQPLVFPPNQLQIGTSVRLLSPEA